VAVDLGEDLPPGIAGTPSYMAPEMAIPGTPSAPRTAVYLLGATLHHVLTNTPRHTAREGLQACLETMIEYELDLGNHAAATQLLADLPVERPDLAERLARVARRAREQAAASERLAAMLRDLRLHGHDWGRSQVTMPNGINTFLFLAIPGELYRRGLLHITPWNNLGYVALGTLLQAAGVLWYRRTLLDTRIYGRLMTVLLSLGPLLIFDRGVGLASGLDFQQVLAMDIAVAAALNAAAAPTITPVMWVSVALAAIIGLVAVPHPTWALQWVAMGFLVNSVWLAWCFRPRSEG